MPSRRTARRLKRHTMNGYTKVNADPVTYSTWPHTALLCVAAATAATAPMYTLLNRIVLGSQLRGAPVAQYRSSAAARSDENDSPGRTSTIGDSASNAVSTRVVVDGRKIFTLAKPTTTSLATKDGSGRSPSWCGCEYIVRNATTPTATACPTVIATARWKSLRVAPNVYCSGASFALLCFSLPLRARSRPSWPPGSALKTLFSRPWVSNVKVTDWNASSHSSALEWRWAAAARRAVRRESTSIASAPHAARTSRQSMPARIAAFATRIPVTTAVSAMADTRWALPIA
mmetsp:Transcript_46337/g.142953  ORF Transcript_46337/g.142953 Transcript_46337/m.142953 type:complete len:288 (-) Transcript_46337:817-1680(-)